MRYLLGSICFCQLPALWHQLGNISVMLANMIKSLASIRRCTNTIEYFHVYRVLRPLSSRRLCVGSTLCGVYFALWLVHYVLARVVRLSV